MKYNADYWIAKLDLLSHPEGGAYREVYRSTEDILRDNLPDRFGGNRSFSAAIYFLLQNDEYSAFHRIKSDELWHFYSGTALEIHVLNKGRYEIIYLGDNPENGEKFQAMILAGAWFASKVKDPQSYSLVGCTAY